MLSATTVAETLAPSTVGVPTLTSPLLTKRTWSNETVSPAFTPSFSEFVKQDPVKTTVIDMTALSLVELTRKKERRPLYEQFDILYPEK